MCTYLSAGDKEKGGKEKGGKEQKGGKGKKKKGGKDDSLPKILPVSFVNAAVSLLINCVPPSLITGGTSLGHLQMQARADMVGPCRHDRAVQTQAHVN